ncbi:MAG: hypothetical protein M5Z89_08535 [Olivibacter sp.]|nr:hypothetical protein [Olivibacter sp. UJ_SKK_5.1]
MEIAVPIVKFEELRNKACAKQITEGYVPHTVFYRGDEYVATGSSSKLGLGNTVVFAYKVMPLNEYNGALKPLEYSSHFLAVGQGERDRSYEGMLTRHAKRKLVFVGEQIRFTKSDEGIQSSLF